MGARKMSKDEGQGLGQEGKGKRLSCQGQREARGANGQGANWAMGGKEEQVGQRWARGTWQRVRAKNEGQVAGKGAGARGKEQE